MNFTQNVIYLNRAVSIADVGRAPDDYRHKPSADHILCRDVNGRPTATYGDRVWDFNPYRLSAKQLTKITFESGFESSDLQFSEKLVEQVKYVLYLIIHFNRGGASGKISASTLGQYALYLKQMARFCADSLKNEVAAGVDLFDMLSNAAYMNAFLKSRERSNNLLKLTSSTLGILISIGKADLGFQPISLSALNLERSKDKQHPVIPSRIYAALLSTFDEIVERLYPHRDRIKQLIIECEEPHFGLALSTQNSYKRGRRNGPPLLPTMEEAFVSAGLAGVIDDHLEEPETRHAFMGWIEDIQGVARASMHLYTGMRDQEGARIKYDCLANHRITAPVVTEKGIVVDPPRMVSVISTTTKFTGYKKEESWIAPDITLKSVAIARAICEGVAYLHKKKPVDCPLYISSYIIRSPTAPLKATNIQLNGERGIIEALKKKGEFRITKSDLAELELTDRDRDFEAENSFSTGNIWPLTSHQFRRSLAFYAANSGFVSLPTVTSQFKHLSKLMTKYYARGNENFLPVFGAWDEDLGVHRMHKSHVSQDFQLAVPIAAIDALFKEVFEEQSYVMGGTGSYLEKQKKRVESGELSIMDARETTMKMASRGELSYRPTLLGGCTKTGPCDDFLMGDITACLVCPGAIIDSDKIAGAIDDCEEQLLKFEVGSAEREIVSAELVSLKDFKEKKHKL